MFVLGNEFLCVCRWCSEWGLEVGQRIFSCRQTDSLHVPTSTVYIHVYMYTASVVFQLEKQNTHTFISKQRVPCGCM